MTDEIETKAIKESSQLWPLKLKQQKRILKKKAWMFVPASCYNTMSFRRDILFFFWPPLCNDEENIRDEAENLLKRCSIKSRTRNE